MNRVALFLILCSPLLLGSPFRRLPAFVETEPRHFFWQGHGYSARFSHSAVTLLPAKGPQIRLRFVGASKTAQLMGQGASRGSVNLLMGSDPSQWRSHLPAHERLRYQGLYPGVDVVFYEKNSYLEFDFVLAPGANARKIRLLAEGAPILSKSNGDLALGPIRIYRPAIHAGTNPVNGYFQLAGRHTIRFQLETYDHTRQLVIDPQIGYATLLPGGSFEDTPTAVAMDAQGFAYITGQTLSADFPVEKALQGTKPGPGSIFVQKLSPDGHTLVFSTYLGGRAFDLANRMVIGPDGNIYLCGWSESNDFPMVSAVQPVRGGPPQSSNQDAIVVKLSGDGSRILFSTYLGGYYADIAAGLAVDRAGFIYVAGHTQSSDFPASAGQLFGNPQVGDYTVFVAKLDPFQSKLVYANLLAPGYGLGLAVDSGGQAFVAGQTVSSDFPVSHAPPVNCLAKRCGGAYLMGLSGGGDQVLFSRRFDMSYSGTSQSVAVDGDGNILTLGSSSSGTVPTTNAAFQTRYAGGVFFRGDVGGAGWQRQDVAVPGSVQAIAVDPTDADLVLISTEFGLFRSRDGGASWTSLDLGAGPLTVTALAADPRGPGAFYAGTSSGGLFHTMTTGDAWTPIGGSLQISGRFPQINRIVPGEGRIVYAATDTAPAISSDAGASWSYLHVEGGTTIDADPTNRDVILSARPFFCFPNMLFGGCGAHGGLSRTSDGGATWKVVLEATVNSFARDPVQTDTIYGAGDSGLFISKDNGVTWARNDVPGAAKRVVVDPNGALYLLVSNYSNAPGSVWQSLDGAKSWQPLFVQDLPVPGVDLAVIPDSSPGGPSLRIYAGAKQLSDCYLTKVAPTGDLLATTLLGGAGSETCNGLGIDADGDVYVAGSTSSSDLPVVNPLQPNRGGSDDAFVVKLSGDLSTLLWSTYVGGSGIDVGIAMAVGANGEISLLGRTASTDFPFVNAMEPTGQPSRFRAFVLKITPQP